MARVNVFIPVYNGSRYIREAITSVLRQSFRDLELIVVDNCSTDGTDEIVENLSRNDSRIKLIRNEDNIGSLANFNKCLRINRGEFFSIICHDDYYCNEKALEMAASVLDSHGEVSAVHSQMNYVDQDDRIFSRTAFKRVGLCNGRLLGIDSIHSTRIKFGIPVLMRSTATKNIFYDDNFTYCAEVDFILQLSHTGSAYFLSDYLIANRFHFSNASRGLYRENLKQLRAIAQKHGVEMSGAELASFYTRGYFWMWVKKLFFSIYPLLPGLMLAKKNRT